MLFALCALILLAGCRTLQVTDYHQHSPLKEPLPALKMKVHAESFAARFAGELFEDVVVSNSMYGYPWVPSPFEVHTRVGASMQDVFTILANELSDNMTRSSGEKTGEARFKLVYYNRTMPGWGWVIPSVMTLNIANLAGMPFTRYQADLELQMEIVDANQRVIAQYRAPGTGKTTVAFYYGYDGASAHRKANLLALQEAMRGIRNKMEPDLARLNNELLAAEPVNK